MKSLITILLISLIGCKEKPKESPRQPKKYTIQQRPWIDIDRMNNLIKHGGIINDKGYISLAELKKQREDIRKQVKNLRYFMFTYLYSRKASPYEYSYGNILICQYSFPSKKRIDSLIYETSQFTEDCYTMPVITFFKEFNNRQDYDNYSKGLISDHVIHDKRNCESGLPFKHGLLFPAQDSDLMNLDITDSIYLDVYIDTLKTKMRKN